MANQQSTLSDGWIVMDGIQAGSVLKIRTVWMTILVPGNRNQSRQGTCCLTRNWTSGRGAHRGDSRRMGRRWHNDLLCRFCRQFVQVVRVEIANCEWRPMVRGKCQPLKKSNHECTAKTNARTKKNCEKLSKFCTWKSGVPAACTKVKWIVCEKIDQSINLE